MDAERTGLNDLFAQLCAIDSPSGSERACADRVRAELSDLGLRVEEDGAAAATGGRTGNLLARIPARGAAPERGMLLCAHLDTVPATGPIDPVVRDGAWRNASDTILGADNKAAVAVILAAARRWTREPPAVPVEVLFTVAEENALVGAKAFDVSRLHSALGYVFDHATPIGEVVVASPTYHRLAADFRGTAAHAGIRPQDGRSAIAAAARAVAAMPLGRLDSETTANVGQISGGTGTNVVPARCRLEAEARGIDPARVEAVVSELIDHLHDGANAAECDVDIDVRCLFHGYRVPASARELRVAEEALRACGHAPRRISSGGGADANALRAAGFACLNLANGTERNHQPDESVSVAALGEMLDVALALPEVAGRWR